MADETLKYLDIDITGIVQGVGFRPFVYRLAGDYGIKGFVTNTPEGVRVRAAGGEEALRSFLEALPMEAPPQAVIEEVRSSEAQPFTAESFEITTSSHEGERQTLISPDLATCDDCLEELWDEEDRRYLYPFINCTNCGPRFTIICGTPYDRPMTTMAEFEMCELCGEEYHDPSDRRFHAQPNACPECGPRLWLTDEDGEVLPGDAVKQAASLLKEGKIVALKGLGGFQLACDAASDQAVSRLRERKNRYAKPLAVMVRDAEEAENLCRVSGGERELLTSPRRPIVLLEEKQGSGLSRQVAPGLRHQGIFLPYTPLHHLLMKEVDLPLVMTSGNLSEEPIAKDNQEALRRLKGIADYFLLHDRGILVRYDDSVTRILRDREYPLRRARGYAPYPIKLDEEHQVEVLALGGELKNTFCFLRGRHAFVGQHIGDMDNRETLEHFEEALAALQRLFSLKPQVIACDLHPDYMTTGLAVDYPLPREGIQHHHAHIVSCMADNGITEKVIGVAWDGTGYGTDNTVWGGEFLVCDQASYTRWARLSPYPMPGGEACITHLNRMALGVLWEVFADEREAQELYEELFEVEEREMEALAGQLRSGFNTPLTSGAGRLFDAAAALVGLRKTAHYEGQAACELEAVATTTNRSYPYRLDTGDELWEIDTRPLFQALISHVKAGKSSGEMAGRFHLSLAKAIIETCGRISSETGLRSVALSGGVFQNQRLTLMVTEALEKMGFSCYVHRRVPCNDGGLSLGQAVAAARRFAAEGEEAQEGRSGGLVTRGRDS
jgi:hydrogenase maturation protein HypF